MFIKINLNVHNLVLNISAFIFITHYWKWEPTASFIIRYIPIRSNLKLHF